MRVLGVILAIALPLVSGVQGIGAEEPDKTAVQATSSAEKKEVVEWVPVPFRVRDLTLPTVLVLGLTPRPVYQIEQGTWAFEFNASVSNNLQMSGNVYDYLESRGGSRRPLDAEDARYILEELEGERFFIDGEFTLFDVTAHYGLTDRLDLSLRTSYILYGGGILDQTIYTFHDTLGLGQAGRDYIANNHFQMVFAMNGDPYVGLEAPSSGGFLDPVVTATYTFPGVHAGFRLGLEAGAKVPLSSQEKMLSSGSFDFGVQLNAERKWRRDALVFNLAFIIPGDFGPSSDFKPASLPSANIAYLHRFGRRTDVIVQALFSENIWRDYTSTDLSELEFQVTAGVRIEALGGVVAIGFTENVANFNNTPDFALHMSYGFAID